MQLKGILWRKVQEMNHKKQVVADKTMEKIEEKAEVETKEHAQIEKDVENQSDYLMKELKAMESEMAEHKYSTKIKLSLTDKNLNMLNKVLQKIVKQNEEIIALLNKKRNFVVSL